MTRAVASDERDVIDRRLEVWARELPDLDLATEGIVERIQKIGHQLDRLMDATLAEFRIKRGEWHLLGVLRRYGAPYRRSPGQLAEDLGLSSGAMTHRLDRLEQAGLVRRLPDPDDRRGLQIELTDAGRRLWEESVGAQAQKEQVIASALSSAERTELNRLLRRLTLAFDGERPA